MIYSFGESQFYADFSPYLARLFSLWSVREWNLESPAGRQTFIIDGDFCSLTLIRDRDFSDLGYIDMVAFGPIGSLDVDSFIDVTTFQRDLRGSFSTVTFGNLLEWLIENREILRHSSRPIVFDRLKKCWRDVCSVFEVFMVKYFAKSEYSIDSQADSFVQNRISTIPVEETKALEGRLMNFRSMGSLISAALTSVYEIRNLKTTGEIECTGKYFLLSFVKIDGFERVLVRPRLGAGKSISTTTIAELLFFKSIETNFESQLRFIVRFRESFEEMTLTENWGEIDYFVSKLKSTQEKYRRIAEDKGRPKQHEVDL